MAQPNPFYINAVKLINNTNLLELKHGKHENWEQDVKEKIELLQMEWNLTEHPAQPA